MGISLLVYASHSLWVDIRVDKRKLEVGTRKKAIRRKTKRVKRFCSMTLGRGEENRGKKEEKPRPFITCRLSWEEQPDSQRVLPLPT